MNAPMDDVPAPLDHDAAVGRYMAEDGRATTLGVVRAGWACRGCGRRMVASHRNGASVTLCPWCDQ